MITSDDFRLWATGHGKSLGLSDRELATVGTWHDSFRAAGYTLSELFGATDMIMAAPQRLQPLAYSGKMPAQLEAIRQAIKEQRQLVWQREHVAATVHGECTICSGIGRVVVPDLRGVSGGQWRPLKIARAGATYYTCAVLCSCALGHYLAGKITMRNGRGESVNMLTLERYEHQNPDWSRQLREKELADLAWADQDFARRQAAGELTEADREWVKTIERLTRQAGVA